MNLKNRIKYHNQMRSLSDFLQDKIFFGYPNWKVLLISILFLFFFGLVLGRIL